MKEKLISFRIPLKVDIEIGEMASFEDSDKSKLLRELIVLGIRERKLERALKLYSDGKVSLWKASRLADYSLWKMIDVLRERKISIQYGEKELREDLKALE